jgi:hypothetical protein
MKRLKTWHWIVIGIFVLGGIIGTFAPDVPTVPAKTFAQMNQKERHSWLDSLCNSSSRLTIERNVEEAVSGKLKSPKSAEFSDITHAVYSSDNRTVLYTGNVDSKNSFGVEIRNTWMAIVQFSEDGKTFGVTESGLVTNN